MLKTGDLVELSAYGKKVKVINRLQGDVGIILRCCIDSAHVKWSKSGFCWVNRRDIKKVRAK